MVSAPDRPLPIASFPVKQGIFTEVQRAADGGIRWKATISDDGVDRYATRMTTDLHDDFIRNWKGGSPTFLTIAHFNQLARIGDVTAMYRDRRMLKAEGRFFTDSADPLIAALATAAAEAALKESTSLASQRAIKVSIGFTPTASVGEDLGVIAYTKGTLPEIAMTTHAANSRTDMGAENMEPKQRALDPDFMEEDAASIVGEELAGQLRKSLDEMSQRAGDGEPDMPTMLYRAEGTPEGEAPAAAPEAETPPTADAPAEEPTPEPTDNSSEAPPPPESEGVPPADPPAEETRAGRKIQGAKMGEMMDGMTQMESAHESMRGGMDAMRSVLDWAAGDSGDGEARGFDEADFRNQLIARFTESPDAAAKIGEVVKARWMELTGNESLTQVLDYNEMQQYVCMLTYTLQDLILANLEPDEPDEPVKTMEQRMGNIQSAINEYTSLINGIIAGYFSSGRSDNSAMKPADVKPAAAGDTAPVKAPDVSRNDRDLAEFDAMTEKFRQVVEGGDRQAVQAFLGTELVSTLEGLVPDDGADEAEPDPMEERMQAVEYTVNGIAQTLERIERGITAPRAEPEQQQTVMVPRRRSFTRPPAHVAEPQPMPKERAVREPKRFTIAEVAERGLMPEQYP